MDDGDDDGEDAGGDAVCWLHLMCPECGALPDPDAPERCWRCGAPRPEGPVTP